MKTIQNLAAWFSKQKTVGKIGIGCVGLILFFCVCTGLASLASPSATSGTEDITVMQTSALETAIAAVNQTSEANLPTNTPEPTGTPSPTDTPLPPPTQNVGVVGERRESGGIAVTIISVSKMDSVGYFTPEAGNVYLVIEALIENVSRDEETPYNPLYFSVKDSDGFQGSTSFASPDPSLQSGNLPRGDKARGFVAFEVRASASGFVVTYEPLVIFGGYNPIRISLGQ